MPARNEVGVCRSMAAMHRSRAMAIRRLPTSCHSQKWDDGVADCRQELVLIDQGIDVALPHRDLDACRLPTQEIALGLTFGPD